MDFDRDIEISSAGVFVLHFCIEEHRFPGFSIFSIMETLLHACEGQAALTPESVDAH